MAFEEQLPQWENEGTQPPQSKRVEGWLPNEKPPASWFNWLFHRAYKALQELQQKAVEREEFESHASRHAAGGPDAITPSMIGAAPISHGSEHNHDGADPIPDLVQLMDGFNAHLNEKAQDDVHSLLSDGKIIEESGSNANGHYVRFADGTQICYATITDSGESYLTVSAEQQGASGDYQAAYEWTFPANFPSNVGRVRAFATGDIRQGETARNTIQSFVVGGGAEPIRGAIRIWCREPFNRIYNFTLFAIGRWR